MSKRSRVTLFALLALIAAFGLILTGCPDAGGSGGGGGPVIPPGPTEVTLEAGSWGEVGTDDPQSITLEETGHYLVKNVTTGVWYSTATTGTTLVPFADGTLSSTLPANAGALPSDGTEITDLDNGKYGVYKYFALTDANDGAVIGDESTGVDNAGKNAVVNIAALTDGKGIVVGPNAGQALPNDASTIVLIIDNAIAAEGQIATPSRLSHQSNIKGTLHYSFFTATHDYAKVQAKKDDAFITLSGVHERMKTTLTVTTSTITAPVTVELGDGSEGTPADGEITELTSGKKYVVFNGDSWSVTKNDGKLEPIPALTITAIDAEAIEALGSGVTKIIDLLNSTTYTVYEYFDTVEDADVIPTTEGLGNRGFNAIYNISGLTVGQSVGVAATAGNTSADNSIIFLIANSIASGDGSGAIFPATTLATQERIKNTRPDNPIFYGFSGTTNVTSTKVQAKSGDAYIALSTVDAATATTLSVSGVKLGAGSPADAVAGDGEITELATDKQYVVFDGTTWSAVKADGTLIPLTEGLSTGAITDATGFGVLTGGEITGLNNATPYTVYLYFGTVASGDTIPTTGTLNNGGLNAIYKVSGLTAGQSVNVAASAGSGNNSIIFLIDGDITASPVNTAAVTLANQAGIKTGAKSYEFSTTMNVTTQVQAKVGEAFITLSAVDATTVTALSVSKVKVGAGYPGAVGGDGKITGLASSTKYLVHDDDADVWYKVTAATGTTAAITLDADTAGATVALDTSVTEISGLTNGTTYSVYLYTELEDGDEIGEGASSGLDSTGVNAVLDISALGVGESVSVIADAGDESTTLIFLIADTVASASAISTAERLNDQVIKNTRAGGNPLVYEFSSTYDVTTTKVTAKASAAYITLSTVDADTVTTLSLIGVKLTASSQGIAGGDGEITGLASSTQYLVRDVDANAWYVVGTDAGAIADTPLVALTAAGASTTATLGSEVEVITGLTNGTTYDVYEYKAVDSDITDTAVVLNTVYTYTANSSVKFSASAGNGRNTYVFFVDSAIIASGETNGGNIASGDVITASKNIKTTGSGVYTFNGGGQSFVAADVKVYFTAGETYFTVMGNDDATAIYGVTRSGI